MRRKTRFVCVSDTHGYTPSEAGFKLPAGNVLIHAGDLTNNGSLKELRRTIDWTSKADFEIKIIVGVQSLSLLTPSSRARFILDLIPDNIGSSIFAKMNHFIYGNLVEVIVLTT